MCTAVDVKKEKKRAYDAEHSCITRPCVAEYSEKMDVYVEQRCVIKFCVRLKKTPSETTALLKEVSRKKMLGNLTIQRWHKSFVHGRKSAEFEPWGSAPQTAVTTNNNNTITTVIEDQASHGQ